LQITTVANLESRVRHVSTHRNCRSQNTEKIPKAAETCQTRPRKLRWPREKRKNIRAHIHTRTQICRSAVRDGIINYLNIFRSGDSGGFWELGGGRWAVGGLWVVCGKAKAKSEPSNWWTERDAWVPHVPQRYRGAGGAVFIKEGQQTITAKSWVKVPL